MRVKTAFALVIVLGAGTAHGQRTPEYDSVVVPQNRIDGRDLGYPPLDVIPDGESAITSLSVAPNGNLYGATTGKHAHLFVFNPRHGYVQPLGFIPDATAVANALAVSNSGEVYVGASPSGHLFKYTPRDEDHQALRVKEPCSALDLGQAVPGESIAALAIDRAGGVVYGLTSPNGHLFRFLIEGHTFADLGVVTQRVPEGEKWETQKVFSRMIVTDAKGNAYTSGEDAYLYEFDKTKQALERLPLRVPAVPGREPWTRVDAFALDSTGLIYGGTSDGYLFRFDPERLTVENLGKPLLQERIGGLALTPKGMIYGVGGGEDDMARLFSYNPATGAYEIIGFVDVNRRPYYAWQAYVISAMVSGLDATVYIGESERISKLYLFYPWQ